MRANPILRPALWLCPLLVDLASPSAVPTLAARDGASTSPSSASTTTISSSSSSSPSSSSSSSSLSSAPATITSGSNDRASAAADGVWVSVDDSGTPHTVTPVTKTVDGKQTVVSAAPYDVTGTVFTETQNAQLTTSTGTAPATATATNGAGAFAACNNLGGELAPFCAPANNETLNPGTTYYIIWDPSYFSASNTSIKVVGFQSDNETDQAFTSGNIAAGWGFYQWTVDNELLSTKSAWAVNVTLRIAALSSQASNGSGSGSSSSSSSSSNKVWIDGPTVCVAKPATYVPPKSKAPEGEALYVGLPVVFGFVVLCLVGTCLWNKQRRHIGLGNIMSRARRAGGRAGYGVNKSRAQRVRRASIYKEQRVELTVRERARGPGEDAHHARGYHDEPESGSVEEYRRYDIAGIIGDDDGRPRRDSEALGSLAGTPTEDMRMDFASTATAVGSGNRFRDELERQRQERGRYL